MLATRCSGDSGFGSLLAIRLTRVWWVYWGKTSPSTLSSQPAIRRPSTTSSSRSTLPLAIAGNVTSTNGSASSVGIQSFPCGFRHRFPSGFLCAQSQMCPSRTEPSGAWSKGRIPMTLWRRACSASNVVNTRAESCSFCRALNLPQCSPKLPYRESAKAR